MQAKQERLCLLKIGWGIILLKNVYLKVVFGW